MVRWSITTPRARTITHRRYIYATDDPVTGEEHTAVEFFSRDGLADFLNNRREV
eukprot:gene51967-5292_t